MAVIFLGAGLSYYGAYVEADQCNVGSNQCDLDGFDEFSVTTGKTLYFVFVLIIDVYKVNLLLAFKEIKDNNYKLSWWSIGLLFRFDMTIKFFVIMAIHGAIFCNWCSIALYRYIRRPIQLRESVVNPMIMEAAEFKKESITSIL